MCGFLLLSYSNFVHKTSSEIFDSKNTVTLNTGLRVRKGHWKCRHSIQSLWLHNFILMFYSNRGFISCRFWDIQCRKILNPAQMSIKVMESGTIRWTWYAFLFVFYSNFITKTQRFLRCSTSNIPWPWNWVRGTSRSFKMSPFDRAHITSY